jgi:predicted ATPase
MYGLSAASRMHAHRQVDRCLPCMRRMEAMARLYGGSFLGGFFLADSTAFEEWASLQREHLQRLVMEAFRCLVEYYERRGDLAQAIQVAYRQVQIEPWLEEAHRQLMHLLALAGRRSAALAQYRTCRRVLAEELGVKPAAETRALYARIKGQAAGATVSFYSVRPPPRHDLPPAATPLVGREEELAELADLLADPACRLVTLTGPGGIGKTRLALEVAAGQVGLFAQGITFVPLAGLDSPDLFVSTIADALRFRFHSQVEPEQQLLDYLREKALLLVLDNMEQLIEESDFLSRMLRRAPGVILLVTSRERLNLREEWVYSVDGLAWPSDAAAGSLEAYGSVALFVQTARRGHRKFVLSDQEAPFVARICQMVQGMPLAVELAAAWVPVRPCEEVAREVEHNLDILETRLRDMPARHRSLRGAFAHSWALLSGPERGALRRLSLFQGGFDREAARYVAGASPRMLDALADKSLLRRDGSGRYEMHRLVRQFAQEALQANPAEQRNVEDLFCDYYARFLHEREGWLRGSRQAEALRDIAAGIDNVRLMWRLAVAGKDIEALGHALAGLGMFYAIRCCNQEGTRAFEEAARRLSATSQAGHAPDHEIRQLDMVLSQLLAWQGYFAHQLGQQREAEGLLERSLDILGRHRCPQETAFSLYTLGQIHCHGQNEYCEAERLLGESLALYEAKDDRYGRAQSLDGLGDVAVRQGRYEEARGYYVEGLALRREIGDLWGISTSLGSLGGLAGRQGAYDEARRWFEESMGLSQELDNPRGTAACLHNLSTVAYLQEDYVTANRLRLETLDICCQIGYRWGIASSLKSLGDVACRLGEHARARRYLEESLGLLREDGDRRSQAYTLNSLGSLAHTMGESQESWQCFQQALEAVMGIGEPALALDIVASLARLTAERGEIDRALELLSFVLHHPASEQQTRDRSDPLRLELARQVAADVASAAEARGRALDLDHVAARVLDRS